MNERLKPSVSIVIPAHNRSDETLDCINSLERMTYSNFEIIVIDDGSTDGTAEVLKHEHPDVKVLLGDGNLWWSGSMNLGIRESLKRNCDYVLTLNQDSVVDPSMLSIMVRAGQENAMALIGAKVYYHHQPNKIWFAGGEAKGKPWTLHVIGHGEEDRGQHDVPREVDWLTGMGMLIKSFVFEKVGLMDEQAFPQHYADIDFSMRAKKAGFKLLYEPHARIWHKVGEYDPRVRGTWPSLREIVVSFWQMSSNKDLRIVWRFYARHCPKEWLWFSFPLRVLYSLLWEVKGLVINRRVNELR